MKFTIVYQSRTGKTAAYARAMAMYLWQKGMNVSLCSTSDFTLDKLEGCDCLLVGCWTSGWFIVNQHPNPIWVQFADSKLQGQLPPHVALFSTYLVRTGNLFKKMLKHMNLNGVKLHPSFQSKTGFLSEQDKAQLDALGKEISAQS